MAKFGRDSMCRLCVGSVFLYKDSEISSRISFAEYNICIDLYWYCRKFDVDRTYFGPIFWNIPYGRHQVSAVQQFSGGLYASLATLEFLVSIIRYPMGLKILYRYLVIALRNFAELFFSLLLFLLA